MITPVNAIIIDKHADYARTLAELLERRFPDLKLLGVANVHTEAIRMINTLRPDLVFMDIDFAKPGEAIFELFREYDIPLVFLKVNEANAIRLLQHDYLDGMTIQLTEQKLKRVFQRFSSLKLRAVQPHVHNPAASVTIADAYRFGKIVFPNSRGFSFINLCEIIFLQADGNYTSIRTISGDSILSPRTLKYFESLLPKETFYRSHKSYIINLNMVKTAIRDNGLQVIMEQGIKLDIADRHRKNFLEKVMPVALMKEEQFIDVLGMTDQTLTSRESRVAKPGKAYARLKHI